VQFVTGSFSTAIKTPEFEKICDYKIWPYGNAKERKDGDKWVFTCQHGEKECYGNLLQTCALNKLPGNPYLFIVCLEREAY